MSGRSFGDCPDGESGGGGDLLFGKIFTKKA